MIDGIRDYRRRYRRSLHLILAVAAATFVVVLLSWSASSIQIGVLESFRIVVDHLSGVGTDDYLSMIKDRNVFDQNIPRSIGAVCAGMVLAVCGAVLQSLIRNPLAEPYTLGISSGALFGMVVSLSLGISVFPFLSDSDSQIVNAFLAALVPTAVVIAVAMFKKVTPTMMILCGIAVMYIFTALTTLIKYTMEPDTLAQVYAWSVGSVSGISWGALPKMIAAVLIVLVPMMAIHRRIDIVAQGDEEAIGLGINPNRLRIVALVIVSVATAIIVCYTGTLGFVGLVAPHVARIFVGSDNKVLIPCSAAIGALMVIGADYVVRLIAPNLPAGVILAIVCSPIFICLLVRMRRSAW